MAKSKKIKEPVEGWWYEGTCYGGLPQDMLDRYYGFVYKITNRVTGKFYIGKKQLHNYRNIYKQVLNEKTGRMNKVREVISRESNWVDYFGSSVEILSAVKEEGKAAFKREILCFVTTKKQLTYYEAKYQFALGCLEPDVNSYNSNILARFYSRDLQDREEKENGTV